METARVDIQRLQLLNDRINQTIDALNQVRLSVHGLQSTPTPTMGQIPGTYGFGLSHSSGFVPSGLAPFGLSPAGIPTPVGIGAVGYGPQISGAPQTMGSAYVPGVQPFVMQNPWGASGLSHSETMHRSPWDPSWQVRASQPFPAARFDGPSLGI